MTFERNMKMETLRNIIALPICIILTFVDVMFFLTFFRLISYRWHNRWLVTLNAKTKPAVDWYSGCIEKGLMYFRRRYFPEKIILFIGLLFLMFIRFTLAALLSK